MLRSLPALPAPLRARAPARLVVETIDGDKRSEHVLPGHDADQGARAVVIGAQPALLDEALWRSLSALLR